MVIGNPYNYLNKDVMAKSKSDRQTRKMWRVKNYSLLGMMQLCEPHKGLGFSVNSVPESLVNYFPEQ